MTMQGYDVSNWQSGYSTDWLISTSDFLIMKATEGLDFTDGYCDGWVQACRNAGHPWGFYHFARNNNAIAEADYFVDNTVNYFGEGIPVLDWEDGQSVAWVNAFVERVHSRTGVWPWIYANPWRFQLGGVNENCGRWVASYPGGTPSPDACPDADGIPVCCWQYTSTPLDKNYFYGDAETWRSYATGEGADMPTKEEIARAVWEYWYEGEGGEYDNCYNKLARAVDEITRTDDPTGREVNSTTHEHVKWIAAAINGSADTPGLKQQLDEVIAKLAAIDERLDNLEYNLLEYDEDEEAEA